MLIAKSTWVPVGKFPRETVQTDPWCATRSSLRGAIWRPSLRLSDKAAHLVNWHAGLQPCGRRGAGVPDAVPYMLLGMPSPDRIASGRPTAKCAASSAPLTPSVENQGLPARPLSLPPDGTIVRREQDLGIWGQSDFHVIPGITGRDQEF